MRPFDVNSISAEKQGGDHGNEEPIWDKDEEEEREGSDNIGGGFSYKSIILLDAKGYGRFNREEQVDMEVFFFPFFFFFCF